MKKIILIVLLSVAAIGVNAVSYEVYKPAYKSAYQDRSMQVGVTTAPSYTMQSTSSVNMSSTRRTSNEPMMNTSSGRFSTYVPDVDNVSGQSYSPASSNHAPGGPRRVKGEDEDDERETDDPGLPSNFVPITDTPWMIMALLALAYIAFIAYRRRKVPRI